MKPFYLVIILCLTYFQTLAQDQAANQIFWESLAAHCGKSYQGTVTTPISENDPFAGKVLIMHVVDCGEGFIHIPFFVGEDKSRTWVLTMQDGMIQLKHDHRHKDGLPDQVTQYGGKASNTGLPNIQFFAADQETRDLIPASATNVWWITIDESSFTYNLRRMGTERFFSVKFDLTKEIENPGPAWGWEK